MDECSRWKALEPTLSCDWQRTYCNSFDESITSSTLGFGTKLFATVSQTEDDCTHLGETF